DTAGGNGTGFPDWARARIKTYLCPSDMAQNTKSVNLGVADAFWTESGTIWVDYLPPGSPGNYMDPFQLGMTNYIACAGYLGSQPATPSWDNLKGPYYTNSTTALSDIQDGTSNTIGFGEALGGSNVGTRDLVISWAGSGTMATAWGITEPPT